MLKNKIIVKKIRNIVILLMAMIIMFGAYKNIDRSRAEDVIEIDAIAIDSYGYLAKENFILEAKQIEDDLYEIELPESVNSKKINNIVKITLEDFVPEVESENAVIENASTENIAEQNTTSEDTENVTETNTTVEKTEEETSTQENTETEKTEEQTQTETPVEEQQTPIETPVEEEKVIEIIDNKIYLTKEEKENQQLNIEVVYDIAILEKNEQNTYEKKLLSEMTEEERIQIKEETEKLYSKILKYEDEENGKLVELKGYLPVDAKLQVEEVSQDQITQIFGEKKIKVAYDIKILVKVITQVPVDEANPNSELQEIVETIEINPEEFGETCEVTIIDANIAEKSQVYHVKEDNTYEEVNVKENTEGNVSFDAQTFSVYAIGDEIIEPEPGEEVGSHLTAVNILYYYFYKNDENGNRIWTGEQVSVDAQNLTVVLPIGCSIYVKFQDINDGAQGIDNGLGCPNFSSNFDMSTNKYGTTNWSRHYYGTLNGVTGSYHSSYDATVTLLRPPTVNIDPSSQDWTNAESINATITATSQLGLATDNVYEYYISNSTTIPANAVWSSYYDTESSTPTKTISVEPSQSGKYYIFTKPVQDTDGNESEVYGTMTTIDGSKYHMFGEYKFDYEAPTMSVDTTSCTWRNEPLTLKIQVDDQPNLSGPADSNSGQYKYYLSNSPTELSGGAWKDYTNGTARLIEPEGLASGEFYLFVKPVSDKAGNTCTLANTTSGTLVTVTDPDTSEQISCYRFGSYKFDYIKPEIDMDEDTEQTEIVQDGLRLHFDASNNTGTGHNASATKWTDLTGNYEGTLTGGSKFENGEYLAGQCYIAKMTFTNALTLETTVSLNSIGTTSYLMGHDESGGYALYVDSEGHPALVIVLDGQTTAQGTRRAISTTTLAVGQKYHIVGTYDGTDLKLYVDGILVATTTAPGTIANPSTGQVTIGYDSGYSSQFYTDGKFYSARIYNKALSATEVMQNCPIKWAKTHNVPVTISDIPSGLAESKTVKYGWSTSKTIEPTSYTTVNLSNSSGAASTSFTATGSGFTGKYYLWVLPNTATDLAGNEPLSVISTNVFYFDNQAPIWKSQNFAFDETTSTATLNLLGTDELSGYASNSLDTSDITVYVNGVAQTGVGINLSGETEIANGVQYTLTLSNITIGSAVTGGYVEFNPTEPIVGGTAKYKIATGSGDVIIAIAISDGTLTDNAGNTNEGSNISNIIEGDASETNPEIYVVQKIQNKSAGTETIIFNVTDKNYDSTDLIETSEITIKVDGERVNNIHKVITSQEIKANFNGTEKVVGHQYTLVLSEIIENGLQKGKKYLEWSGTLEVVIAEDAAQTLSGNTLNTDTTTITDFIDFMNPYITYEYSEGNISYQQKNVTIVFSVIDKYFRESLLDVTDLTILVDGELPGDTNQNGVIDGTEVFALTRTFTSQAITDEINGETATIGYTYTLVLSEFEQDAIASGKNYLDYSGIITVGIPSGRVTDTSGNINSATTITVGVNLELEELPGNDSTQPYLPEGYYYQEGNLSEGLVIIDSSGNEYVWVEVPKTTEVYKTAGLNITQFTDDEYTKIETDLQTYTSAYRTNLNANGGDTYYSNSTNDLTENEYNIKKKKMLKSVYKYGGFYIGRYETGIEGSARTAAGNPKETPVIKKDVYPYNYISPSNAQRVSTHFGKDGYTSNLLFGVQWDLVLKYLETSGAATQEELITNSTNWGNYKNTTYSISNTNAKYYSSSWNTITTTYEKTTTTSILLTTGASEAFCKQKIYDLAGNVSEITLERNTNGTDSNERGGWYAYSGTDYPAGARIAKSSNGTWVGSQNGFRVALYKDDGIGTDSEKTEPTYIPDGYTHLEGTTMENGYVIQDSLGNQFVWIEVPRTAEVYPTASIYIENFTDTNYTNIENDLHTYTTTYRNSTTHVDEYYSDDTTGLTSTQYTELKRKMLKSIYVNEGFYVGRYETGIADSFRTAQGETTQTPVIKQNAYPYNYLTAKQAQTLSSENFATDGYISSLMFGVQWDLIMKYLETKGMATSELNTSSIYWGNYSVGTHNITNDKASYSTGTTTTWTLGTYTKSSAQTLYTTGASNKFSKQNISDLAGNLWEYTLEYTKNTSTPTAARGGGYTYGGDSWPAAKRTSTLNPTNEQKGVGFRVALYQDVDLVTNEENSSEETIVDFVRPTWELGEVSLSEGIIKLRATDKYFSSATIDEDDITIYVGGVAATTVVKDITSIAPTDILDIVSGVENTIVGKEYTLQLSNITFDDSGSSGSAEDITFTPSNLTTDGLDTGSQYKYKQGASEGISIEVASGTIVDKYGNTSELKSFDVQQEVAGKPEIYLGRVIQENPDDNSATIILNVTSGKFDTTDLIQKSEISVLKIAGQNYLSKATISTPIPIKLDANTVVGHQYKITISNIPETARQTGKKYLEWSGDLEIQIASGAAKDALGNTTDATTLTGFIDVIEPEFTYAYSTGTTIDGVNNRVTVVFYATDKYYTSSTLQASDITATIGSSAMTVQSLTPSDYSDSVDGTSKVRGKIYTLVLYANEKSGTVTINIPSGKITDTSGNTNNAQSIIIGINIPEGTGSAENVDLINPTVTVNTATCDWRNSALSVTITAQDTGGSELSTSNSYQYFLSNNATALSGGSWTNYTTGNAITLNPGTDGTYYLFVKKVVDNTGNISTSSGDITTVDSVSYHRFGPYKFDYTKPTYIGLNAFHSGDNSTYTSGTWTNDAKGAVHTTISASDALSGVSYIQYREDSEAENSWHTFSFSQGALTQSGTTWSGTEPWGIRDRDDKYYFKIVDKAGNEFVTSSTVWNIKYDITEPTKPTYTAFHPSDNVSYTSGSWTNYLVHTTISSTDTSSVSGVESSGIKAIQYSKDKTNWTTFNFSVGSPTGLQQTATNTWSGTEQWGLNEGSGGRNDSYYFKAIDNAGNESAVSSTADWNIRYDLTKPTVGSMTFKNADGTTYTPGSTNWTNQNVNLTLINGTDSGNFVSGHKQTTYTINGTASTATSLTTEGTYTIVITTKDNAGNVSNTQSYTVNIDKTRPTLTVSPTSVTWRKSALSVTVTHNDTGGSGLASTSGSYFLSTSSSPTAVATGTALSGTYTSGTAFNINPGTSGQYYLFVQQIADKATNKSSTTDYVTINGVTYHRYGVYQFDYDLPVWSYVSKDIYYSTANDAGNDNYANKERTVKITFKGTDATSKITSTLTKENITVKVNGTAVTTGITKTLTTTSTADKEIVYTLTITGITGDGTLSVELPSGSLTDQASNTSTLTNIVVSANITIDNTNPNLTLAVTSPTAGYYKAGQVITITATYNEDVYKEITSNTLISTTANAPAMTLKFGGVAAKNTVSCTSVSGRVFTYTYTIKGDTTATGTNGDNGTLVISSLGTVYDRAGNAISASNVTPSVNIVADTIAPTVTSITPNVTSPTNASSITYTVVFSEAVTGFVADDVTVNSGKGSVTSVEGSGTTWTVVVSTTDNQEYTETITVKANGATIDRAGNKVATAKTSDGIVVDRIDPTVSTITANRTSPTNAESITYTVTFSENVTGFTASDVTVNSGKGTITSVTGSGTTYTVVVSTTDNQEYTETITIKANGATIDKAGNKVTTAKTSTGIVVDRIDPTVSTITANRTSPTNASSITYTVTFSEAVTGFAASDVTVNSGKGSVTSVTGSGTTWTVEVSTTDNQEYTETITIKANGATMDKAGNKVATAKTSDEIVVDRIDPTVTSIIANRTSPTNASSITYTVTFSENVTGFTEDDVTVNSGKGSVTSVTGSGTTYTVVVSTTDNQEYTETITIKANGATIDKAGNKVPTAKTSTGIVVDRIDPTVTSITANRTSPTNAESITYTVVFSEAVTGFVASDVTVNSGKGSVTSVSGSGTTYTVVVSTTDNQEYTETITIKANGATIDKAGNKVTTAKTSDGLVVDRIDPTWTYVSKDIYLTNPNDVGNDNYANADRTVVIVFKGTDANGHNVTSTLTSDAIPVKVNGTTLPNTNKSLATTNNGTSEVTCTLTITGITGDGTLDVQIPSGTLTDQATNTNTLTNITTSVNITIDNTKPTVSFAVTSPAAGYYKAGQVITITATYNDTNIAAGIFADQKSTTPITTTNAPAMALSFGNTAAKGTATCTNVSGRVLTYTYTIQGATPVTGTNGDNGVLKITSLGTVYDAAGNSISQTTTVTPSPQITADTILPTLAITSNKTSYTNASEILYTFTFSENVTGFTADDVTVTNGTKGTFTEESGSVYTLVVSTIDDTSYTETVSVSADKCTDIAGNGNIVSNTVSIQVDRVDPVVTVTPTLCDWRNSSINVTITTKDDHSGLYTGNVYEYFLSTNSATPTGGTWTPYTSGTDTITLNPGVSGTYYLFVKQIKDSVTDTNKNTSTTNSYHIYGEYKFDYDRPTLTVSPSSNTWKNSALSVIITHNDTGGSGVASTSGSYFLSTNGSPTAVSTGTALSGTYTSGTAFNINPGTSGQYYLFVQQIADNATNKSSTTNYVTINGVTYHRYGLYQFDYDLPVWNYVSKDIYYSTANDAGNDNYANEDRTVVITFKGTDVTSNITSTLTLDNIAVSVNGTAVANSNKSLTTSSNNGTAKEVTCTLTVTGITGDGTLEVVIPAGKLTDQATNTNASTNMTTAINITADNTSPTLNFAVTSPVAGYYKAGQVITITATYNEDVYKEITSNTLISTTANAPTMTLKFGGANAKNTVSCTSVSGRVFTYTYTIKGPTTATGVDGDNGTLTISLGTVYDRAGNAISASNVTPSVNIVADTIAPTVISITPNVTSPTNASSITYTVVFSEAVTGFVADDVTVNSGYGEVTSVESSNGTGNDTTWTVVVSTTDNQEYTETITVKANGETIDRAGNKVPEPKTSDGIVVDRIDPTVTSITPNVTSPTNASSITYTVVFSENVRNFAAGDVTVNSGNGSVTSVASSNGTGNDTTWTVVVSTTDDIEYTETITIKTNGATIDKAGNKVTTPKTSDGLVVDRIDPTWTYVSKDIYLTNPNDVGNDSYANADRTVVIVFKGTDTNGHNVTSTLTSDAIAVKVNGTAVANSNKSLETSNNGTSEVTCTLTITGITGDGTLDVQIPSGTLTDQATNTNTLTNITTSVNITIDNTKPTVSFAVTSPTAGYYKAGQVITITATYNDTNIAAGIFADQKSTTPITTANAPAMALSFGNTAAKGTATCTNVSGRVLTYTYTIQGATPVTGTNGDNGVLKITSLGTVYDAAGNSISQTTTVTPSPQITADTILPTLTITSNKTSYTNASEILYTFTFSENVTGFTADDVTVAHGTKGTFTATSGTVYTLVVSTIDDTVYTENISVAADGCIDIAGNGNVVATPYTINVDRKDPTITATPDKTTNATANNYQKSQSVTITVEDEGAGLLSSNSYQYFLSSSSTSLSGGAWTGGTWTNYTSGTAFTIGTGLTGDYYLFVKTVKDNVTDTNKNISNTLGTMTTIDGTTYHMFGTYKFDNTNPYWIVGTPNKDYANKKVTVDIIGTDDHSGYNANTLDTGDIEVWVDGTKITNVDKQLSTATTVTEGIKYTLTLTDFEEDARQSGKKYKEWSGTTDIVIIADTLEDNLGNKNTLQNKTTDTEFLLGHIDLIDPEFTYQYSETVINKTNKIVTIVFYAADKYLDTANSGIALSDFYNPSTDEVTALTTKPVFAVDGEPININVAGNSLTPETLESGKVIKYTLVVANLQANPSVEENSLNDGYTYSGIVSIAIPADEFIDTSNNGNEATTITIGTDELDGEPNAGVVGGVVVDVVDPVWKLDSVSLDDGIVKLQAIDKYFNTCTIDEDDITVIVNGVPSTAIVKDITSTTPTNIYDTVNGVTNTIVGKEYTLRLTNITPTEGGYKTFTPTNLSELDSSTTDGSYAYKYKSENGGDISIQIASGTITDKSGNSSVQQKFDVGSIDVTKPEVYEVRKTQNASGNTETIVFNVTDRNYDYNDLVEKTEISLWIDNTKLDTLRNNSTLTYKEIWGIPEGTTETVRLGHQYTLVIPNIAETAKQDGKDYLEYSGTLKITVAETAAKDFNLNNLNTDTTTITDFIDYLKPQMEQVTVTNPINTSAKTYTMSFKVIDKYLYDSDVSSINMITENEITVYVDGEEASSITKNISSTPITATMNKTVNGAVASGTYTIGHTYTLVLGGFEQASKQGTKDFFEWSGTVKAVIAQNATTDTTGNTFDADVTKRTLTGEHVDFIKPVLEEVTSTRGTNTETILFNIMDKYLVVTDSDSDGNAHETIVPSEITVYVDGEAVTVDYTNSSSTGLNGELTWVQDFTHTVNGNTSHIVGQQYQLVLSGFEQASRNAKDYKDYSGTVTMEIAQTAVADTKGNTLDSTVAKRTVTGDFVDFIKPELEYTHSSSDINHGTKTYTMTFDVTDKYYDAEDTNNVLTLDDLTITMDSEYSSVSDYDLKALANQGKINIAFSDAEKSATFNKTVGGAVETTATSHVIGHTYTLTISNLDQLEIADGDKTVNYSGIITVVVAENQLSDTGPAGDGTNLNQNIETEIVSGVNVPGGSGSGTVVDVVSPLFDKVSSSAYAFNPTNKTSSIGTITFKATDRYFVEGSGITADDIQIVVDGSVVSTGITKIFTETEELTEDRIISGTPQNDVQYGVQYTLQITGWAQNAHQVKIRILAEKLTDQYGNKNIETDLIVYNCLELTSSEVASNSGFLGNTNIERQEVHNVTFLSNVSGAPKDAEGNIDIDNDECWDVSARNDQSIIAWRTASVPYTVYIGSKDEIFANQNSKCLFAYIGYGSSSTATETITNINSLNIRSVTDMTSMFEGCGADAMTTFTLGSNFNTSNVTKMGSMFKKFGNTQLASLSLGTQFITNEVTDMSSMFEECGQTSMTSLILGSNFNTQKVTNMNSMFKNCTPKITSIDLGTQFDTSIVTDMGSMFEGLGTTSLTSLDLGNLFYTSKVTVTDMNNMFKGCGNTAMTVLDLGPAFTKISTNHTDFMKDCGTSTLVIYAPESIYSNRTTLKTN